MDGPEAFFQCLAHCKAQCALRILRASAKAAWYLEVVQFVGVFDGHSGSSLAVGEAGQPRCGGPVTFGTGGVGRRPS